MISSRSSEPVTLQDLIASHKQTLLTALCCHVLIADVHYKTEWAKTVRTNTRFRLFIRLVIAFPLLLFFYSKVPHLMRAKESVGE